MTKKLINTFQLEIFFFKLLWIKKRLGYYILLP